MRNKNFYIALIIILLLAFGFIIVNQIHRNVNFSSPDVAPLTIQNIKPIVVPPPIATNKDAEITDKLNVAVESEFADYYQAETKTFKYFIEEKLFYSTADRNLFIEKLKKLDQQSYDFLKKQFSVAPTVDKIISVYSLESEKGVSYAMKGKILNYPAIPYSKEAIAQIQFGNTHELVHIWFAGLPIETSWFEEGLADFMRHWVISGQPITNLACQEKGWQNGYYVGKEFVATSDFVAYSDFSQKPSPTADFYNPQNKSSYYRSAECFWQYLYQNFGQSAFTKIAKRWYDFKVEAGNGYILKNIISPALNANLEPIAKKRYNYSE